MKVLSLFDGMACGMLAMQKAGIPVGRYVAYEIDKYAVKTSSHNFPMIEHRGDVFEADFKEFEGFDFLIGGSPCTYWSIAQSPNKRETTASGLGWELFSQYVRAVREAKPKWFVYENNKSMSKAIRASIDEAFGFEAVGINSALVSAQNRQRLYWVGKRNDDGTYSKVDIRQPEDRGILLRDILETATNEKHFHLAEPVPPRTVCVNVNHSGSGMNGEAIGINQKCRCLTTNKGEGPKIIEPIRIGTIENDAKRPDFDSQQYRVYSPDGKSVTICGQGGGLGAKTGLYAVPSMPVREATKSGLCYINPMDCVDMEQPNSKTRRGRNMENKSNCLTTSPQFYQYLCTKDVPIYEVRDGLITIKDRQHPIKLLDGFYIIRKLTVLECMRLQTVPDSFDFPVSNAQAYKMLGNGWTVDVIAHIFTGLKKETGIDA